MMNRTEFVTALRDYPRSHNASGLSKSVANTLADHVENLTIPYGEESYWRIRDHILAIIGHAMPVLLELEKDSLYLPRVICEVIEDVTGSVEG